jgi:hypothetical protein
MTKKQIHQEINQLFFRYMKENFPQYGDGEDEMGGRVGFLHEDLNDNSGYLEYHLSQHTIICLNNAKDTVKEDCLKIELFLNDIVGMYNL